MTWRLAPARPREHPKALWITGLDRAVSAGELWRALEAKGVHPLRVAKLKFVRSGAATFYASFDQADFIRCYNPDFFPVGVKFRRWGGAEPDPNVVRE